MSAPLRLPTYAHEVREWVNLGYPFWGSLLVPLVAILAAHLAARLSLVDPDDGIRYAGLALQLLGMYLVARELARAQAAFKGGPGSAWGAALSWITKYWKERPRWKHEYRSAALAGSSAATFGGVTGKGVVRMTGLRTLEERVADLEKLREEDHKELEQTKADLEAHKVFTRDALSAEATARQKLEERFEKKLRDTATGGMPDQVMGWTWLVLGAVLSSLPDEVVRLLGLV